MITIQIDGTFTFHDNVKHLKIGDKIKLIPNPNNRINSNAIGAYTQDNKKIGYIPFKKNQLDINLIYNVCKINLTQNNPIVLITANFDDINFIIINENKNNSVKIFNDDVKNFKKYLERNGHSIKNIYISYIDENFIDLTIKCDDNQIIFNTVSKKYYEENVFKYDEFNKYNLTPHTIYQPFLIHRLESYILLKYKDIDKLIKNKKKQFNELNYDFDLITVSSNFDFLSTIVDIKPKSLYYNHKLKGYCYVDYHNNDSIIDIIYDNEYDNISYYLVKLLISNKKNIILYNPILGNIYKLELTEIMWFKLYNIKL